jgi:ubiquinone/menaquinone biosynthesis C-methylase UbiE
MNETPMYQMNPTTLFSGRAKDYANSRPSYPDEAITAILAGIKGRSPLVVDIGAGTGIASRLLANKGVNVIAIEPNADMRQAAEPHPFVEYREATAEATHLPNNSVDLITCFQSFHWFNPSPTLLEFYRILKPSGRLALVWGIWDESDAFTKEFDRLVFQASNNHSGLPSREAQIAPLKESSLFQNFRHACFFYQQLLDLSGLIGLAQSQGFVSNSTLQQQQLVREIQELYKQNIDSNGKVCLVYNTDVYLAERAHSNTF